MSNTLYWALAGLSVLAACSTPQERCVREVSRELETVTQLIAETELNLQRGFTYQTEVRETRVGFTGCVGSGRYYGTGVRFCGSNDIETVQRAVPIDPEAERRKLTGLKTRQRELAEISTRAESVCAGRYGG